MAIDISVIVPVYNSMPYLPECLYSIDRGLRRFNGESELIIVDNESTDGSYEYLQTKFDDCATILRSGASSVASVRNVGADVAAGKFLAFLDSDCTIREAYFEEAVNVLSETGAAATGAMVAVSPAAGRIPHVWYTLHRNSSSGSVQYLNSANFFMRRSAFDSVGGFDDTLPSGEDADLCRRLRESGFTIIESPALTAQHWDNPRSISEFIRQQIWHGLGSFRTITQALFDKPTLVALFYGLSWLVTLIVLFRSEMSSVGKLGLGIGIPSIAPVATTTYRFWRSGNVLKPVTAISLFHVYFLSRLLAFVFLPSKTLQRLVFPHGWK